MDNEVKTKNRNSKEYIRNYMKNKYNENPLKAKKYQSSCLARRKYSVPDTILERFGNDIHHIIKIHHLINELEIKSLHLYLQHTNQMGFCEKHNVKKE